MRKKLELLNQKVSWTALLVAALMVIPSAQQHRLNLAKKAEHSADTELARATLELSALRLAAKASELSAWPTWPTSAWPTWPTAEPMPWKEDQ